MRLRTAILLTAVVVLAACSSRNTTLPASTSASSSTSPQLTSTVGVAPTSVTTQATSAELATTTTSSPSTAATPPATEQRTTVAANAFPDWLIAEASALGLGTSEPEVSVLVRTVLWFGETFKPSLAPIPSTGTPAEQTRLVTSNRALFERLFYATVSDGTIGFQTAAFDRDFANIVNGAYVLFGARPTDVRVLMKVARDEGMIDSIGSVSWQPLAAMALLIGQLDAGGQPSHLDVPTLRAMAVRYVAAGGNTLPALGYLAAAGMELPSAEGLGTLPGAVFDADMFDLFAGRETIASKLRARGNFNDDTMGAIGFVSIENPNWFAETRSARFVRIEWAGRTLTCWIGWCGAPFDGTARLGSTFDMKVFCVFPPGTTILTTSEIPDDECGER